jgi:t-SNARE complex subunit (syntaxin)
MIHTIAETMPKMYQLFKQTAELVDGQHPDVEAIEENTGKAKTHLENATKDLVQTVVSRKKARWWERRICMTRNSLA